MARKLDELQKRYNSSSHTTKHIGPRHGGPGMRGRHQGGKPKKTKETIVRIISYLKNQIKVVYSRFVYDGYYIVRPFWFIYASAYYKQNFFDCCSTY